MKISRHENFAVSRSKTKKHEIKMPGKTNLELNREIKMQRNTFSQPGKSLLLAPENTQI